MIIALDAMGGDHAPAEIVRGGMDALVKNAAIDKIIFVGDKEQIQLYVDERSGDGIDPTRYDIYHTVDVIGMDEHPAQAYRQKRDASIAVATRLVKQGKADAIVSAGSTGAQMVTGLFELGRINGIKRPAIAVLLPNLKGFSLLVDAGANTEVDAQNLLQFAMMGNIYMKLFKQDPHPKVALINNGSEEAKGSSLTQSAYALFKEQKLFHFIGHIEGREITSGEADVMVTDGFTGNVILKTLEGFGRNIFSLLKSEINTSLRYKLGALLLKPALYQLKNKLDAKKVGGAPLLGVQGVDIICHGNSDRHAIYYGIQAACDCVNSGLIENIKKSLNQAEESL